MHKTKHGLNVSAGCRQVNGMPSDRSFQLTASPSIHLLHRQRAITDDVEERGVFHVSLVEHCVYCTVAFLGVYKLYTPEFK